MTELNIPFTELIMPFHSRRWHDELPRYSPLKQVPVLWEGLPPNGYATYDSLAIVERLHELNPTKNVLPKDPRGRAIARSLMAAFHSGFHHFRNAMPMNIRASYPNEGLDWQCLQEIEQILSLVEQAHKSIANGGEFICGDYSAADAFYTPVFSRFLTYRVEIKDKITARLMQTLLSTRSFNSWRLGAEAESAVVPEDEPYQSR